MPRVRAALAVREALWTLSLATALASALYWLGHAVPLVGRNLHGFVAIIFLYSPSVASRLSGLPFDYNEEGALTFTELKRSAAVLFAALLLTWPFFVAGFFWFYGTACQAGAPAIAQWWWQTFAPVCPRWLGPLSPPLAWPPDLFLLVLSQFLVVALPEELFFRGYLWSRLEQRWPSRKRLFGAPVGPTWLLSSVLFAVGHVAVDLDPRRFAVFFPALVFGWMRARSGSIVAGLTFHALCNLLSDVLYETYFK